jgi:hypothetical protein
MIFSKLSNPWSWSPGADEEYTEHINRAYLMGMAVGELKGRLELASELEFGAEVEKRVVH